MPRIIPPDAPSAGAIEVPRRDPEYRLPVDKGRALSLVRRYYAYGEKYQEMANEYSGTRSYRPARTYWGGERTLVEEARRAFYAGQYTPFANTNQHLGLDPNWEAYGQDATLSPASAVWAMRAASYSERVEWVTQAAFIESVPSTRRYTSAGASVQQYRMEELAYYRTYVPRDPWIYPPLQTGYTAPIAADPMRLVRLEWMFLCRLIHQMLFVLVRRQEDRQLKLDPGHEDNRERERAMAGMDLPPTGPIEGAIQDAYSTIAGAVQAWQINNGSVGP